MLDQQQTDPPPVGFGFGHQHVAGWSHWTSPLNCSCPPSGNATVVKESPSQKAYTPPSMSSGMGVSGVQPGQPPSPPLAPPSEFGPLSPPPGPLPQELVEPIAASPAKTP